MATSDNTVRTYDRVGIEEDVDDVISMLEPDKTQFLKAIGQGSPIKNTIHQYQEDTIRAPQKNAVAQGADAVVSERAPTQMRSVQTQILQDTMKVAGTTDAVEMYGRGTETDYQTTKTGLALKQDLEYAMVSADQAAVAGDDQTPSQMASIHNQIDASKKFDLSTTDGTTTTYVAMTEDDLNTAMQALWNEGIDPAMLMASGPNGSRVSTFAYKAPASAGTGAERAQHLGGSTTLVAHIDVFEGPFGSVRVVKNRVFDPHAALIMDPDYWKLLTLRGWSRTPLAITGDARAYQMLGEFTFKHRNYNASALILGLPQ